MVSCTNETEDVLQDTSIELKEELNCTRSSICDTVDCGELVRLEQTEELLGLKRNLDEIRSNKRITQTYSSSYDDFFQSNIYAIRELPITISVRSVANGSTASNKYFYCDGAGKEVTLSNTPLSLNNYFHLTILPSTSGIPYLIYSNKAKTPLTVGYYTNNKDNKILMADKDNTSSLYYYGWDLIPSSYKGYFYIQSESYLGQTDPNDMWSVFNYVLEAKANNKIGYAQRVANKGQQEFLITPTVSFTLQDVKFDLDNATITNGAMLSKVTSVTNPYEYPILQPVTVSMTAEETSSFTESGNTLKLNINVPVSKKFPRPRCVAGKAIFFEDTDSDAVYSSSVQNIATKVTHSINIEMKPMCLLQLTTKFKTFILNVPYVAEAKYKDPFRKSPDRDVKVRGIWRGLVIANPAYNTPINEAHFYNLETGEEINYSLSYVPTRKIFTTK